MCRNLNCLVSAMVSLVRKVCTANCNLDFELRNYCINCIVCMYLTLSHKQSFIGFRKRRRIRWDWEERKWLVSFQTISSGFFKVRRHLLAGAKERICFAAFLLFCQPKKQTEKSWVSGQPWSRPSADVKFDVGRWTVMKRSYFPGASVTS